MPAILEVEGLEKSYGSVKAVDGLTLRLDEPATLGLVGPNGAGKTTTVECLEGLREPDRGLVRLLGLDPRKNRREIFSRVGVQLQERSLYHHIRVREALELFATFYRDPLPPAQLLDELGLDAQAASFYIDLSGGEKRKALCALALVGQPELLLLDEPTSGLDPQSRVAFWQAMTRYRRRGGAILLTTHDLLEAEEHCDVIAIVDHGRVVATGPPRALLERQALGTRLAAPQPATAPITPQALAAALPGLQRVEVSAERILLFGDANGFLTEATRFFAERGVHDLRTRPANLEDLYFILTGRDYPPKEARP